MSEMRTFKGFEEVWRPPVRLRAVRPEDHGHTSDPGRVRARLARIVTHAPEVMVKVSGRTRDGAHLKTHLDYIARNGALDLESSDGGLVRGRREIAELAQAWWEVERADSRRRSTSPVSLSLVLSMPAGTPEMDVRDAARAFAEDMFAGRHAYVFTLHTDTPRPHVHLSICARGDRGERLNPKKADLETWRQAFAQALRDRGVAAEATPRRARGVVRKADRAPVRRIMARAAMGTGAPARVVRAAELEAARAAFQGDDASPPWQVALMRRQLTIRALYLAQARLLRASDNPADQALGRGVEAFLADMPAIRTRKMELADLWLEVAAKRQARQDRPVAGDGPRRDR